MVEYVTVLTLVEDIKHWIKDFISYIEQWVLTLLLDIQNTVTWGGLLQWQLAVKHKQKHELYHMQQLLAIQRRVFAVIGRATKNSICSNSLLASVWRPGLKQLKLSYCVLLYSTNMMDGQADNALIF